MNDTLDFYREIGGFTNLKESIEKLENNGDLLMRVHASNRVKPYIRAWANGEYDEDVDLLGQRLENIVLNIEKTM